MLLLYRCVEDTRVWAANLALTNVSKGYSSLVCIRVREVIIV